MDQRHPHYPRHPSQNFMGPSYSRHARYLADSIFEMTFSSSFFMIIFWTQFNGGERILYWTYLTTFHFIEGLT